MDFLTMLLYLTSSWNNITQMIEPKTLNISGVTVFTADRLEVTLDVNITYQSMLDENNPIANPITNPVGYRAYVESFAKDQIKLLSTKYTIRSFYLNQTEIESNLRTELKLALEGTCCPKQCRQVCPAPCKPRDECRQSDKGILTLMKGFHLVKVTIPDIVLRRLEEYYSVTTMPAIVTHSQ